MRPRASPYLRVAREQFCTGKCIIYGVVFVNSRRLFTTKLHSPKHSPPRPPVTAGVDLNDFLGSPGWKLEDLLPPSRPDMSSPNSGDSSPIIPETLRRLLQLSGLPPPQTAQEESNLLSALHDQLHFVRHVQSVSTEDVKPLIRVGYESHPADKDGVLSYQECVEEIKSQDIPGLEWTPWDVCGLKGGSREGRDQGWFVVSNDQTSEEAQEVDE